MNQLRKRKPQEIIKEAFTNNKYVNKINLAKNKYKFEEKIDSVRWKIRNIYGKRHKFYDNMSFLKTDKIENFQSKTQESFSRLKKKIFNKLNSDSYMNKIKIENFKSKTHESFSRHSKKNIFKKLISDSYKNKIKEKVYFIINNAQDRLKIKTYRIIFYFLSFVLIIMFIKYLLTKLFEKKNSYSNDEKNNQLIERINDLLRENEELRFINHSLLESKSR